MVKWIIDVRAINWEEIGEEAPTCDHCEERSSEYWIEELATPICGTCYEELNQEQIAEKQKEKR